MKPGRTKNDMKTTAQTHDNGTYYVRNAITGLYWNGSYFGAQDKNGDLSDAKPVPGSALPILRATWEKIETVVTGGQLSKNAAKQATAAVNRAAEEKRRKAEAEAKAEREAARRAEQRKDDADYLAKTRAAAVKLTETQPTTGDEADLKRVRICKAVGQGWLDAQETLALRSERMLARPAYYFDWADVDMEAAARCDIYGAIIGGVERGTDIVAAYTNTVEGLKAALISDRFRGASTSSARNSMDAARRSVASSIVGYNDYI